MTNKCVLKPKLWQGFLILFFQIYKFASKHSMIAQMSCQYAPALTLGKKDNLKSGSEPRCEGSAKAHAQCHRYTLVRPTWKKSLVNSYIYIEVDICYRSIQVDERDLSRMV